jgi:hypothetical protein
VRPSTGTRGALPHPHCYVTVFALVAALATSLAAFATPVRAANQIYWGNYGATTATMSFANLDGSGGGGVLNTAGATVSEPFGVAIDAAGGRIYWANDSGNAISVANLDGSGGAHDLNTTGATPPHNPEGVAIDPAAGKIYWANNGASPKISFANMDGSGGGGDLNTTGATVSSPDGVALDIAGGRIYWSNSGPPQGISFARLDGSGGGNLATLPATVSGPVGVALDLTTRKIYWTNNAGNKISFANLDGSGGGDLNTSPVTVSSPEGLAVDPIGGRAYWANYGANKISFANLDGSGGGGDLSTGGGTMDGPALPALLYTPTAAGAPVITGEAAPGSVLSCSPGSWAADLLGSFLYRAPRSVAYQWTLNGTDIAGASTNSYTAFAAGDYRCTVTASNQAGSTAQTSAAHTVVSPPVMPLPLGPPRAAAFGARTRVTLTLASRRIPVNGPLKVRVGNRNGFAITGVLAGETVRKISTSKLRRIKLRTKAFRVGRSASTVVALAVPRPLSKVLKRTGGLQLLLTARVTDPARHTRIVRKQVTPLLKRAKR